MTTTRILICLMALLLVASYASATTIQELCKGTPDPNYCSAMLQKIASQSTDFKSEAWRQKLLNTVLSKALVAQKYLVDGLQRLKGAEADAFKTCVEKLNNSVQLIKNGSYEYAWFALDSCYDSLEAGGDLPEGKHSKAVTEIMPRVRTLADDASTACKVAVDIVADLWPSPKTKA